MSSVLPTAVLERRGIVLYGRQRGCSQLGVEPTASLIPKMQEWLV